MAERLRAWAWLTALGGVWGIAMAWWYGAPLARGLAVGLTLWGIALFGGLRGPYAPAIEVPD